MSGFTPSRRTVLRTAGASLTGLSLFSHGSTAMPSETTGLAEPRPTCCTGPASTAVSPTAHEQSAPDTTDVDIREDVTVYMHPGEPETVWVSLAIDARNATDDFYYVPSTSEEVIAHTGFDRPHNRLEWDGTDRPHIIYTATTLSGWAIGPDWALANTNSIALRLRTDSLTTTATRSFHFPEGGYRHAGAKSTSVFVGPNETESRLIAGEPVTYVRPETAFVPGAPTPDAFFEIIDTTAELLGLADPNPAIGYIVPWITDGGEAGVATRGVGHGTPDFASVGSLPTTIGHEYVHTQQSYIESADYTWVTEGLATFYDLQLGYRLGYTGLRPRGVYSSEEPLQGSSDPNVVYRKGAVFCFLLDLELRKRSDGAVDMSTVMEALNTYEDPDQSGTTIIGHDQFKAIVADVLGENLDTWLDDRIVEPRELELPADLEEQYPGPEALRPNIGIGRGDTLRLSFTLNTRDVAPDTIVFDVEVQTPEIVQLGDVDVSGDEYFYDLETEPTADGTTMQITLDLIEHEFFEVLTDTPPMYVTLHPTHTGGAIISVSGQVTYQDGTQESLTTRKTGRRLHVDTPAPAPPTISPTTIAVDEPAELSIIDPKPELRYLWTFTDGEQADAVGTTATRTFHTRGDAEVKVTAVDRNFDRTTTAVTVTVSEDGKPSPVDYADEDGIVQTAGLRDAIDDWRANHADTTVLREVIDAWRSNFSVT